VGVGTLYVLVFGLVSIMASIGFLLVSISILVPLLIYKINLAEICGLEMISALHVFFRKLFCRRHPELWWFQLRLFAFNLLVLPTGRRTG